MLAFYSCLWSIYTHSTFSMMRLDTYFKGTPAHINARSFQGVCHSSMPILCMTTAEDAIFPRSLWKYLRGATVLYFNIFKQFSNEWAQSSEKLAFKSSSLRKERSCTRETCVSRWASWTFSTSHITIWWSHSWRSWTTNVDIALHRACGMTFVGRRA